MWYYEKSSKDISYFSKFLCHSGILLFCAHLYLRWQISPGCGTNKTKNLLFPQKNYFTERCRIIIPPLYAMKINKGPFNKPLPVNAIFRRDVLGMLHDYYAILCNILVYAIKININWKIIFLPRRRLFWQVLAFCPIKKSVQRLSYYKFVKYSITIYDSHLFFWFFFLFFL